MRKRAHGDDSRSHSELTPRNELTVLRRILERVPEGLVVVDTDGRFLYFNPAARRIVGLGSSDVDPSRWADEYGLYGLDGAKLDAGQLPLVRALNGESVAEYKMIVRNKALPNKVVINVNAEPLTDRRGMSIGALATFHDVTAAYRSIKVADDAIAAIEYRDLIDALHEGLWMCDKDGTTLFVNQQMARSLGYEKEEIKGRPYLDFVAEDHHEACLEHLERRRKGITEDYEIDFIGKDGRRISAIVQASPLYDHRKRYRGSLAGVLDITVRKQAQRDLESANERLEQEVSERTANLRRALEQVERLKEQLESENITLRKQMLQSNRPPRIVGSSDALKTIQGQIAQVARTDTSVLLLGETGTGKGLLAASLHQLSRRVDKPFVTVDCASLPPSLMESELFGIEKGAYTGADSARAGRFELADGGTLFLDEIAEVSFEVQAKLLRFLERGAFQRLGSTQTRRLDVRVVSATNRDLGVMVREGTFRSDLFFRLNVFPIRVPPLRDRREDLPDLTRHFISRKQHLTHGRIDDVAPEVYELLARYFWPGNIRELENVIERALILATGNRIEARDLSGALNVDSTYAKASALDRPPLTIEQNEREFLLEALRASNWKVKGPGNAAERVGLPASTLRDRMRKLGIARPPRAHRAAPQKKRATGRRSPGRA